MPLFATALATPRRVPTLRRVLTLGLVLAATWGLPAQSQRQPGAGPAGPVEVGVVTMAQSDVPYIRTLPGRAVAFETGEIRSRVSGVVEDILYKPGDTLKPGDAMFQIEDKSYAAEVAAREAALASAEVQAAAAEAVVARYRSLQGSAVTKADLQQAEATAASAVASTASANAALDVARLDLDHTVVRSPINGIAGLPTVSVGALVTSNQADALAIITRLDPIYVDVSDSSAGLLRLRAQMEDGSLTREDSIGVALVLEDGQTYDRAGTVVVRGNVVSSTTGTFDLRVQFDNPNLMILPGQFLRVNMTLGSTRAWLVPQRATGRSSDGTLTAFVAVDGVAKKVSLTSTGNYNNAWVVTAGVQDGDQVIVDGLSNLRDGAEVTPVPVTIDQDGVVRDVTPQPEANADPAVAAPDTPSATPTAVTPARTGTN